MTVIKLDPDRSTRAVDRRNLDGFTEHLRFCELIGADPCLCVNAGTGSIDEAAAWVRYCNRTGAWQVRALNAEDYATYQGRSSRPAHQKDRGTGLR